MAELLMSFIQGACLAGYLYGAWLVISHAAQTVPRRPNGMRPAAGIAADDTAAWQRYLACDV